MLSRSNVSANHCCEFASGFKALFGVAMRNDIAAFTIFPAQQCTRNAPPALEPAFYCRDRICRLVLFVLRCVIPS